MLLTKDVIMKWNRQNRKYYTDLGYIYTKYQDEFEVKVEDLPKSSRGSRVLVDVKCDNCDEILKNIKWNTYIKNIQDDGRYYCLECTLKLYGSNNSLKIKSENSKTFEERCYLNLSKEDALMILLQWDYNLNIDKNGNVLNPKDAPYSSAGFNRKGYWFKCLDNPEHKSKQVTYHYLNSIKNKRINCKECNILAITHPHIIKYLVNPEDAYKYSHGSNTKIPTKCPDCGYEKPMSVRVLSDYYFFCPRCSDGVPYPEKFVFSMLEQLFLLFDPQLRNNTFKWCENYQYDFYINNYKMIIETHGLQHYEVGNSKWGGNLIETQENDKNKENLARINGIDNYIVLNCRRSTTEWIKNSIMNNKLPQLLNFKEEDIDWLKCHEYACSSLVKVVCDMWTSGIKTLKDIADKLQIGESTTIGYLRQGAELGWCDYKSKEYIYKQVICLTTREIFITAAEAGRKYNVRSSGILACCKKTSNITGENIKSGEKLKWMYYDEYILKTEDEINDILKNAHLLNSHAIKIKCLTTKEIFNSIKEAFEKYKIAASGISRCCKGKAKYAGKHPETGDPMVWEYQINKI